MLKNILAVSAALILAACEPMDGQEPEKPQPPLPPCDHLGLAPITDIASGDVMALDGAGCRALVAGGEAATGSVVLHRCPLTGGECSDVSLAGNAKGARSLVVDTPRQRLLAFTNGSPAQLLSCKLDGTDCASTPLDKPELVPAASRLNIDTDGTIVYFAGSHDHITRCPEPPGACTSTPLTGLPSSVDYADFVLDSSGEPLIVFENKSDSSRIWYARCDAAGSCTSAALSPTSPGFSSLPRILFDQDGSALIAAWGRSTDPSRMLLHRCGAKLDGTNCETTAILPDTAPALGMRAALDADGGLRLASVDDTGMPFVTRCTAAGTDCTMREYPEAPKVQITFNAFAAWQVETAPIGDAEIAMISTPEGSVRLVRLDR